MKRWKYVLIAAVVIGLIVAVVQLGSQPMLKFDKSEAVEADWDEIFDAPRESYLKAVYVRGEVLAVDVLSDDKCLLWIEDVAGRPYMIDTSGPNERWVQPQCCKLRKGDRVIVWGYVGFSRDLPEISAWIIEKE